MARMACNRHTSRFVLMFILSVTSFCHNKKPSVSFNELNDVSNFHMTILAQFNPAAHSGAIVLPGSIL